MLLLLKLLVWAVRSLARFRQALVLDNLALRHQLATLTHRGRRPRLLSSDRRFWVALRAVWSDWTTSLAIVRPATVVPGTAVRIARTGAGSRARRAVPVPPRKAGT